MTGSLMHIFHSPHGGHGHAPPTTPVGTVVAFAGDVRAGGSQTSSPPDGGPGSPVDLESQGWMFCDGRTLKQSQYNELFQVIGYLYGKGSQDGEFMLPDYRGYFLRCLAVNSQQDPGFGQRAAVGQGTKDGVGSTQDGMVQTHEHKYTDYPNSGPPTGSQGGSPAGAVNPNNFTSGLYSDSGGATSLSGDETRPKNVYVYYIIKYTNKPNLSPFLPAPVTS